MWAEVARQFVKLIFLILGLYSLIVNSQIYKDFIGEKATSYTISPKGELLEKTKVLLIGDRDKIKVTGEKGDSPLSVTIITKTPTFFSKKQSALSYLNDCVCERVAEGFKVYYGEDNDGIDYFMLSKEDGYPKMIFDVFGKGRSLSEAIAKYSTLTNKKAPVLPEADFYLESN